MSLTSAQAQAQLQRARDRDAELDRRVNEVIDLFMLGEATRADFDRAQAEADAHKAELQRASNTWRAACDRETPAWLLALREAVK